MDDLTFLRKRRRSPIFSISVNHNIKYFILEPVVMERILLVTVYPNLAELKLFNFEQQIASKYFTRKHLTYTS
ncbi:unnamed protein product [Rotaria socialis]|uniref:Uncharacterized protein n=1 Tax=Rotaria socialis TaxID=392032 RepID=A0A821NAR8_9BILA|nr:unnamed protein product [Rotaria socialis]